VKFNFTKRIWGYLMRGAKLVAAAVVVGGTTWVGTVGAGSEEPVEISMAIIVNNVPVDENVAGFKERMEELGYVEGENVVYTERNAQGQTANADLVARQSVDDEPDLIYVVGTPIVIALQQQTDSIPVVFSLMTDPVGAGVVDSFEAPGTNFTGTSDAIVPSVYFDLIEELLPDAQNIGILGNTGEQNSESQIQQFEAEAAARGLDVTVVPTPTTNDVQSALRSLEGRVDAVLVGADGTVLAAADTLIATSQELGLPLIVSGTEFADQGALAGVGPDFRDLGRASADIVDQILSGGDPATIPVVDAVAGGGLSVAVNEEVAAELGVIVPEGIEGGPATTQADGVSEDSAASTSGVEDAPATTASVGG
jgi:putative ABC transport system substrate-binding protein